MFAQIQGLGFLFTVFLFSAGDAPQIAFKV